ncbi:DUF1003 domain-containing protein [Candidatus Nephthysia bennettiae]|uniref:DUF1003 domain-containing protein n=1 Tax=Candidatus Nephthysia bennettiae TaxID=3127016 RepID=A0A934K0V9_9BACT|nr:DUF1003 domain-containing protein [Candidatus Dormibacteraeota bacterium]
MLAPMSTATQSSDPSSLGQRPTAPPKVTDEYTGFNGRLAAALTKGVGSMWVVYFTTAFTLTWVALATFGALHNLDPYPFPFLLFLGNVTQLLLVFVILVGQQVLGLAADKRSQRTYKDAEAIFSEVSKLHAHLQKQDMILNRGIALAESQPHPWIQERKLRKPARAKDQYVGLNGRTAAWITDRVGSMWAFYVAAVFQFGWMALALVGVIKFDPYPFAFLLFLSSLAQLIFMFVIMVGQDVLGKAGDQRAEQTFLDAEAVLHECLQLQHHLTAQDRVIVKVCEYIQENAPKDHSVHAELGRPAASEPPTT